MSFITDLLWLITKFFCIYRAQIETSDKKRQDICTKEAKCRKCEQGYCEYMEAKHGKKHKT